MPPPMLGQRKEWRSFSSRNIKSTWTPRTSWGVFAILQTLLRRHIWTSRVSFLLCHRMYAELKRLSPSGGLDIEDYALSEQVVPGITITEDEDDRRPLRELGIDGTWSTGLSDEEEQEDDEVSGAIGRRPENITVSGRPWKKAL